MSTTVIINPKTGLGQPANPWINHKKDNRPYNEFQTANPALPVITAAGETLRDGRYECEKVWQYYNSLEEWCDFEKDRPYYADNMSYPVRQVWKVIETPELPGEETVVEVAEDSQLKPLFELIYEKYGLPLNKKQLFEIVIVCNDITNNTI